MSARIPRPTVPLGHPAVPWYLRWYVIIPLFFVWPSLLFPIGPIAAIGLSLVRLRTVPSSSVRIGWLVLLISSIGIAVSAFGVYWAAYSWLRYPFWAGLIGAGFLFCWGLLLLIRGRKPLKLVRLVSRDQLATVEEIAGALRTTDLPATAMQIESAVRKGWLNGYAFDRVNSRIVLSGQRQSAVQVFQRSLLGSACVLLAALLLFSYFRRPSDYEETVSVRPRHSLPGFFDVLTGNTPAARAQEKADRDYDRSNMDRQYKIDQEEKRHLEERESRQADDREYAQQQRAEEESRAHQQAERSSDQ